MSTNEGHIHPAHHVFSIAGMVTGTVLIVGAFLLTVFYTQALLYSGQMAAVVSSTLVALANEDRVDANLGTLTVNPELVAAAQAKANDMAEKGYFSHTTPEGYDSWHWFHKVGYEFAYAGENLAVNFSDSDDVEEAWMNSPTHRANILNGKFTEIGIATAVGEYNGKKALFVAQMFGTPKAAAAPAPASVREITETPAPEEIAIATTEEEPSTVLGAENEPAAPAVEAQPAQPIEEVATNVVNRAATSPHSLLQIFYLLCGLVVIGALALVTELEFKQHHMRHVAVAGFFLMLMGSLLVAANYFVFVRPVLA